MIDTTIINFAGRDGVTDPLTDLLRKGARELLWKAWQHAITLKLIAKLPKQRQQLGRLALAC